MVGHKNGNMASLMFYVEIIIRMKAERYWFSNRKNKKAKVQRAGRISSMPHHQDANACGGQAHTTRVPWDSFSPSRTERKQCNLRNGWSLRGIETTGFKSALGSLKTYLASPREPAIYFLEVRWKPTVPEVIETHTANGFYTSVFTSVPSG